MFHIVQAAHAEAQAIRETLHALALRIANGEAVILRDVHALRDRVEALFGHTAAAVEAAHPANTPEAGMAPQADTLAGGTDSADAS